MKWPDYAVIFDCETHIDTRQGLTFGLDDDLAARERDVLEGYVDTADTEVKSLPPRFPLHPRSDFVKQVFYRYARKGALIVGFNLPFDLTRLARRWPEGKKNEWSLVLVRY